MNISTEQKLLRDLFNESSESNPVVTTEQDRFHLEDYVQYQNKPGIIVATIKGESESGIQQLPIGAVDNFRFMKITDENAIINQNKNNGKPYDSILQEYESSKNEIIDQWKKNNTSKLEQLKQKYGDRFLGVDIIQNEKKIQHKETQEEKEAKKELKEEESFKDDQEFNDEDHERDVNNQDKNEQQNKQKAEERKEDKIINEKRDYYTKLKENIGKRQGNDVKEQFSSLIVIIEKVIEEKQLRLEKSGEILKNYIFKIGLDRESVGVKTK